MERNKGYEVYQSHEQDGEDFEHSPNYLVTMPCGIGDAVYVGLTAIDQMTLSMPESSGNIDVLCNETQAELFQHDPRVNQIIVEDGTIFPGETPDTWKNKTLRTPPNGGELLSELRPRDYKLVFPGNEAFGFWRQLDTYVAYPKPFDIVRDYWKLRRYQDAPASLRVRNIINQGLRPGTEIAQTTSHATKLYIPGDLIEHAQGYAHEARKHEGNDLLVVAPDTSSPITRPPTTLLSAGIKHALNLNEKLQVVILPSFRDETASTRLGDELAEEFSDRLITIPGQPKPSLLAVTALIDQADILITGDTSIMHLAAVTKVIPDELRTNVRPRNSVKILALFGGTNPGLYGYSDRTIILGRGRKEQRQITPGLSKRRRGYDPSGKEFFDHITPDELAQAIIGTSETPPF